MGKEGAEEARVCGGLTPVGFLHWDFLPQT